MEETTTGDIAILYAPDGESKVMFRDEPKQDKPTDYEEFIHRNDTIVDFKHLITIHF